LQTVGEILRAEREKKGISIRDVEQGTSIRGIYLQAIDDGKYSAVPGEVYLKGFIRNYANFIGLSGQEMVEIYRNSQIPTVAPPPIEDESPKTKVTSNNYTKKNNSITKPLAAFIIVVALTAAALLSLNHSFFAKLLATPPVQQQTPPVVVTPPPPVKPAPVPTSKPVVLAVKYLDQSWTQVFVDGKEVYEGMPIVGETLTWTADHTITIKLGNAASVNLTYNGQLQSKLGNDGEVVEKIFSAPGTLPKQ
jgi:cytoskeletal protein RodZ